MLLHNEISEKIMKAFYNVYNSLGYGFLEKVYENAMIIELRKLVLNVQRQIPIKLFYEKQLVGAYFADIVVEGKVIVELKAAEGLYEAQEFQLINYLKAS